MASKKNKNNISVIIPVHKLDTEKEMELLKVSVSSVQKQEVKPDELLIVVPKGSETEEKVNNLDFGTPKQFIKVISNPGKTDLPSQLNYGVKECKTDWFTYLQFDDELNVKWVNNIIKYRNSHNDVDIFMPIIIGIQSETNNFVGLINEVSWAPSFADELGFIDEKSLLTFPYFSIDGITMKKETFLSNGALKTNMKMHFAYEFLLRLSFRDVKTMVIPKYGYKHLTGREGSIFESYRALSQEEAQWWLEQAKKEYYYTEERELNYSEDSIVK